MSKKKKDKYVIFVILFFVSVLQPCKNFVISMLFN